VHPSSMRALLRGNVTGSALLMTVMLAARLVPRLIWLIMLLRGELVTGYQASPAALRAQIAE
jgi:hypothetical protein